jgi:two-component system heavy metal sensor histidine kinase CusS
MKPARSIASRLTLTFAITAALTFLAAGVVIVVFQYSALRIYQFRELRSRMATVASLVTYVDSPDMFRALEDRMLFLPRDDSLRYILQSSDPAYRFGPAWPQNAVRAPHTRDVYDIRFDGRSFMASDRVIPARGQRPEVVLTVALDHASIANTSRVLAIVVILASVAGVTALTLLGRRIVVRGLRPVGQLSQRASELDPAELSMRLPLLAHSRELDGLTLALNDALSRLEDAYTRLAAFNADVAHELRTPLANLIGQTQVALSRKRSTEDLEEVLQGNLEDLDRLREIVNDMLFLARADQGVITANLSAQSLAAIVRKTADFMDIVLDEASVRLEIVGDALVAVEPPLLARALTNLIDNAVRHGERPGAIRVVIEDLPTAIRVSVHNRGAPIAPNQMERLFDRFYRPDPSRKGSSEIHGLGLAIVKAVAVMHRGEVFAQCANGEIVVGLALPKEVVTATEGVHGT